MKTNNKKFLVGLLVLCIFFSNFQAVAALSSMKVRVLENQYGPYYREEPETGEVVTEPLEIAPDEKLENLEQFTENPDNEDFGHFEMACRWNKRKGIRE